jgi:DNA replication protein DnaC
LRSDVPLDHPDFGKAVPCECKVAEFQEKRLADLREASNLDSLSRLTFESFVPDGYGLNTQLSENLRSAFNAASEYAAHPEGWLILRGKYGCGKTHLAAAIANDQIGQGNPVLFVVVPDLLDYLRATYGPNSPVTFDQRFEAVRTAPLLILDDLGTQNATSWASEKLFQLLNYRYNARIPTVITTNQSMEDIERRLLSRMTDPDVVRVVTILAHDFRGSIPDQSTLNTLSLHSHQTSRSFLLRTKESLKPEQRRSLRSAKEAAKVYAQDPRGWLVVTGPYGAGKTHLAAAIANHLAHQGEAVLFVSVADLLDHLRATFSPASLTTFDKAFREIRSAPFLVLDDVSMGSATPWAQEKLFQLLDYRFNGELPTVLTVATESDVHPRLKARLFDRSHCLIVSLDVPSFTGQSSSSSSSDGRSRPRN